MRKFENIADILLCIFVTLPALGYLLLPVICNDPTASTIHGVRCEPPVEYIALFISSVLIVYILAYMGGAAVLFLPFVVAALLVSVGAKIQRYQAEGFPTLLSKMNIELIRLIHLVGLGIVVVMWFMLSGTST